MKNQLIIQSGIYCLIKKKPFLTLKVNNLIVLGLQIRWKLGQLFNLSLVLQQTHDSYTHNNSDVLWGDHKLNVV